MKNNDNVVRLKRKPRPLKKTYEPNAPYTVVRVDQEDGSITYEVHDWRPDSYRIACFVEDDGGRDPYAKHDAEQITRALNFFVQYGKETLPTVRDPDESA